MRKLLWLPLVPTLAVACLVLEANGLTPTTLMAFLLPSLCAAAALGRRKLVVGLLALGVGFVAARLLRPRGSALSGGATWQRVIDEREATRAGLSAVGHLGIMQGREFDAFDRLIDDSWKALPPEWQGQPNALLMHSSPGHVEALRFRAPGAAARPCVIFLHGYGGLLTLYLHALVEGTVGKVDVVAPALDPVGRWWTADGQQVLRETLDALPPEVDRRRVFLVGLSNGAVGATTALLDPSLARRFAGVVLLSGVGNVPAQTGPVQAPVLVLSGSLDHRFSVACVERTVAELQARHARVTWHSFPADHFLLLTHQREWSAVFRDWATLAPDALPGDQPHTQHAAGRPGR